MRFFRPWPDLRPGVATFFFGFLRPWRTSWLMLGIPAGDASSVALRGQRRADPGFSSSAVGDRLVHQRPQAVAGAVPAARTGAGVRAAATMTSRKANDWSAMPSASLGIGSPNTTMPPAMQETLAPALVI